MSDVNELLTKADAGYELTPAERAKLPGLHWCPDWDYLLIYAGVAEYEFCTCPAHVTKGQHRYHRSMPGYWA